MTVRIKLNGNPMPERHGEWYDLCTAEDVTMEPLEFRYISLGVAMELPKGYYANLLPRSSTFKKHGIMMVNSMGVVEHDFCGEEDIWKFPAVAIRHTEIPKGSRICQFRLVKQEEPVNFEEAEILRSPSRGGLGSTGV